MFTKNGRALTSRGVKPICPFQQKFESSYLFGLFSPINGQNFILELPLCNSENFQLFLNLFSETNPTEYKIIVLDNAAFHKAKVLEIPENMTLVFLPPYSPELNPAEKVWAKFKRAFTGRLFHSLDSLSEYVCKLAVSLTKEEVISISKYDYIFFDPFWSVL